MTEPYKRTPFGRVNVPENGFGPQPPLTTGEKMIAAWLIGCLLLFIAGIAFLIVLTISTWL